MTRVMCTHHTFEYMKYTLDFTQSELFSGVCKVPTLTLEQ